MYAVTVTFEIMPEHADEIMPEHAEAFREAVVKQAENSVKKEEKCRQFDVCADPGRPDVVFLYEIYDDAAAFREHLASDHFKIFDAAVKPWLTGKTVETWDISPARGRVRTQRTATPEPPDRRVVANSQP